MISFITCRDLFEDVEQYDVILIGTNTYCSMSQGFQRKVMLNYPYVQEINMKTKYADSGKLGTIVECKEDGMPLFVLMYINECNFRPDLKKDYLSYESLEKCIKLVNVLYKGKKVATTFVGASKFDGNGDKEKILSILSENSNNISLTIYDYEQKSKSEELKEIYISELKLKEVDMDEYYDAVRKRKEKASERKKINGHAGY